MGLDRVLEKFSKKKLFGLVFGVHLILICLLGVSFNFQKPEKEIKSKADQVISAKLVSIKEIKPPAPVKELEPEPVKDKETPKEEPKKDIKKPKVDKKKADFALKQKKEKEERERKKKEEDRKKKLAAKKEADRLKKLKEKKERERKEKIRQQKLAEQRQQALAEKRAREAAERVSNGLEATYLQELGQRLNLSWRKPSFGVQIGSYVTVRLTIERDGRISKAEIRDYRANSTMMASVKDLIRRMKTFKRFPAKITERRITQDFKLEIE